MKKIFLLLSVFPFLLAGCAKDDAQPQSSEKEILSFQIDGIDGSIFSEVQTIHLILPSGTDLSALSPVITVSDKAKITPASGVLQDFSTPVHYTVTAEDGTQQDFLVGVAALSEDAIKTRGENDVTVWVDSAGNGTAGSTTTVQIGSSVTVSATPNAGYLFDHWNANPGGYYYTNPCTFYPTKDTWITAYFSPKPSYTVTVQSYDNSMGSVSGGGYGNSVYVEAIPTNPWYVFDGWYLNGSKINGLGASGYYSPNGNCTLVARFSNYYSSPTLLNGPYYVITVGNTVGYSLPVGLPSWVDHIVWSVQDTKGEYYPFTEENWNAISVTFSKPSIFEVYCDIYAPGNILVASYWLEALVQY